MFEDFALFLVNWLKILGACAVVAGTIWGVVKLGAILKGD